MSAPASLASGAGTLAQDERRRITIRLGAGLLATGLLGLGTILIRLLPDQWQIGELIRGLAVLAVALPTLASGVRGLVTADTRRATDQLVATAILAAAATGSFVTATLIPLFLEAGRLFEERSSLGARAAIDGIRALAARQAVRWARGAEERVDPSTLSPGDEILVRPGERIAADGTVLEGRAAVDSSAVTGESLHQEVGPGSPVFAGTIALDGLLKVRVRGAGSDSVLGRVVLLLAEVEGSAVPMLRLFEQRAGVWLPLVLTVAATTLYFTSDLSRAIAVLVAATPTALVVAGPAAMMASMTVASRLRILIKSTDFLERASDVDTLILDKTGTVTVGAPVVDALNPVPGVGEETLLRVAASCGFGSLHPVSRAVVAEAQARGIALAPPSAIQEKPGLGVVATLPGGAGEGTHQALLGRRMLLADMGVGVDGTGGPEDVSRVWVASDGQLLGTIVLRDRPRPEAKDALAAVRAMGIDRLVLLTGDRQLVAREVGEALGMDEVVADVLPAQKLEVVRAEQARGRVVMMVGDGVNDAPALAAADVGVAIGAELNEVALGGADVALLGTDLGRLPRLIGLSDKTRQVMGQNVLLSLGLSVVLIALAIGGVLDPVSGAIFQSLAVFAVVGNSARILGLHASPPTSGPSTTTGAEPPLASAPSPTVAVASAGNSSS
ncbi:MAG TPA: cation-translocating P-type ATPase [Planctomycetota bacterium]|nr:cation-translocating P-type ATPase [Planctomycetota bacterium]